jgi:hypothetical protein
MDEKIKTDASAINAIADLAARALGTEIETIKRIRDGDVPVVITDGGRKVHNAADLVATFEKTQPTPYRRRGTFIAADVASLLAWMAVHAPDDAPVFASGLEALNGEWREPKLALTGIANYSAADKAAWHDFQTVYNFPIAQAWEAWAEYHAEGTPEDHWFKQGEFAEFIEDHIHEISSPARNETLSEAVTRFLEASQKKDAASPSELFKLSRDLKIFSNSKIETKLDLQSGETQLQYTEEHTGAGGRPVKIPALFYIRIPVFFGQDPVLIGVKLRYRSGGGQVLWSYSMFAPEMIVRDEFAKACKTIELSNRTVFLGTADRPVN